MTGSPSSDNEKFRQGVEHAADEFLGGAEPFGVNLQTGQPFELELIPLDEVALAIDPAELVEDRRDAEWQDFTKRAFERRQQLRLEGRIR